MFGISRRAPLELDHIKTLLDSLGLVLVRSLPFSHTPETHTVTFFQALRVATRSSDPKSISHGLERGKLEKLTIEQ